MPTAYTSLLGLALPVTGELQGTWGTTVNDAITSLLDTAVAGTTTLSTDADVTLTTTTGASNQARQAIILWTANGTVTRNITAPAQSKTYVVINASAGTQSIVIRGAGPTAGVTVLKGERVTVAWNGSDFVKVGGFGGSGTFNDVTITTGNLSFTGTAQRITGDMSNATLANRLAFQTSTTNGNTTLNVIPNGTGTASQFVAHMGSDPANTSRAGINVSGSAALVFSDITGTGTYLPMTFYTGGSERMRIDTSGNVAVGTTNAGTAGLSLSQGYNLSWEQSATESIANLFRQTSSAALVMSVGYKRSATANGFASSFGSSLAKTAISLGTTAGAITFYTDTAATTAVGTDVTPTERMRLDSSGNLSIGSTGGGGNLFVSAANTRVRFSNTNGTASTLLFGADSGSVFLGAETNSPIYFITNNLERMRLDSSGNVGIGTASPGYRLDVQAATASTLLKSTTGTNYAAHFLNNTGGFTYLGIESSAGGSLFSGTAAYSAVFGTVSAYPVALATNGAERMRIDSSGNVGIGTASPGAKLDVNGLSRVRSPSDSFAFDLLGRASDNASVFRFLNNTGVTELARIADYGNDLSIFNLQAYSITFGTNTTERMRIDASGNVGVGTTSPAVRLQATNTSGEVFRLTNTTATERLHFYTRNAAGTSRVESQNSDLQLFAADPNPVTFGTSNVERMRIDSSGNVGIGTASLLYRTEVLDTQNSGTGLRITNNSTGASASVNLVFGTNIDGQLAYIAVPGGSATDANQLVVANRVNHGIIFRTNNTNRASITAAGNFVAGAQAALATTATDGFLYVPTCAGTPTGTPTAITGMAPIVVNTTNNKLYFYSGGAWRDAGP